jgi:predicted small secreted protein
MVIPGVLALLAAAATACNTIEGIGKDVKAGGAIIEEGAEKTKEAISD